MSRPRAPAPLRPGFFILLAADIAAMAPGTNTGAAHPVSVTGSDIEKTMKEKITNDAVSYIKTLAKKPRAATWRWRKKPCAKANPIRPKNA